MSGFTIEETMTGTHHPCSGGGPKFFEFKIRWGHPDTKKFLKTLFQRKAIALDAEGIIKIEGLCESTLCHGCMILDYFGSNTIKYNLHFIAQGGLYMFQGEKINIKPWNIPTSHTTCFGVIKKTIEKELISTCRVFFEMSTLPAMLASLRMS